MISLERSGPGNAWEPSSRIEVSPLAFIDLETTGLHPERGQRITEAAVLGRDGQRLHACVDQNGPEDAAIVRRLVGLLANVVAVGHHVLFDLRFISQRASRVRTMMPETAFVDTVRLARQLEGASRHGYRLADVARRLGLSTPDRLHRAVPDARLARSVFRRLVERHGLKTLSDAGVRRARWRGR